MATRGRKPKLPGADDLNHEILELLSEDDKALSLIPARLEDIPKMPIEVINHQKELLEESKKRVNFLLDGKKLQEAVKIIGGMEAITDIITDPEVLGRVKDNTKSAMDVKFLAEAYSKLADKMQTLQRLDSVDGEGNAGRIMLSLETKDGKSIKAVIE